VSIRHLRGRGKKEREEKKEGYSKITWWETFGVFGDLLMKFS
jgi:hypothetical protein